jgi:hypothetical protein
MQLPKVRRPFVERSVTRHAAGTQLGCSTSVAPGGSGSAGERDDNTTAKEMDPLLRAQRLVEKANKGYAKAV